MEARKDYQGIPIIGIHGILNYILSWIASVFPLMYIRRTFFINEEVIVQDYVAYMAKGHVR